MTNKNDIDDFLESLEASTDRNRLEQDIRIEKMLREMIDTEIKRDRETRQEQRQLSNDKHQYIVWYLTLALGAATLISKVLGWW